MKNANAVIGLTLLCWGCGQANNVWQHWTVPCSIRTLDVISTNHIRFAGSDGWVGQTLDGGDHWTVRQWHAPDSTTPSFRASSPSNQSWFATGIASPAWIAQSSLTGMNPTWVHHDTSAAVFLDAMAWWNDREGLVFGDPIDSCLNFLTTQDGGQTWHPISCTLLPTTVEGEAGFAASNGNICIQGDTAWVFSGGRASRCFRSTDRGHSWEVFSLPIRQGGTMTGVFSASFADAKIGLAMGGNWEEPENNTGNLISTTDGGATWHAISEGEGPGYRSSIRHHPIFKNEVVSVGKLGIDVSMDGGNNWTHVSDSSQFVARFSADGRTLWMAGNQHVTRCQWRMLTEMNETIHEHNGPITRIP
ncbi:MAG: oxidoreductase [Bacteroidota bacterium]|nr:oxidoreductase [Bacteroidota bacterium]